MTTTQSIHAEQIAKHVAEKPGEPWLGSDFTDAYGLRRRCFQRLNHEGKADIIASYCDRTWLEVECAPRVEREERAAFMLRCLAYIEGDQSSSP